MQNSLTRDVTSTFLHGLETARSLGATAAKLIFHHEEEADCAFEAGRLKETGGRERLSYKVEVIVGGRTGASSGNRLDALPATIERAVDLARVGAIAHFDSYPVPGDVVPVKTHSQRTLEFTRERMIDDCRQMSDALNAHDSSLWIRCSAERLESEALVMTTSGLCHSSMRTYWRLGAYVKRTRGSDVLTAYYDRKWCDVNHLYDPVAIAETVITELRHSEHTVEPPVGRVKACLSPRALGWMLSPILMGASGRRVYEGTSPLAGKRGKQILAPALTIIDDPHRDYASGARAIDDDGVPTRRQTIFENGVLRTFLYDLETAHQAGTSPTGNNECSPYWPVVFPGDRPSAELLADIDDGLYVSNLLGFGMGNVIDGDFSCGLALGYRIRNGQVAGRVKDAVVSGNLYELFGRDAQLSSDLDYSGCFPHAVVEGLSVNA